MISYNLDARKQSFLRAVLLPSSAPLLLRRQPPPFAAALVSSPSFPRRGTDDGGLLPSSQQRPPPPLLVLVRRGLKSFLVCDDVVHLACCKLCVILEEIKHKESNSMAFIMNGCEECESHGCKDYINRGTSICSLSQFVQQKMVSGLINANPIVYERKERQVQSAPIDIDQYADEPIDQQEIFDHIRDIKDPEHPYSLEELKVVTEDSIEVNDKQSYVRVTFTPTVEHCSMATDIGLSLRVKLMRSLPSRYKVDVRVAPGTHATEAAVNKQLNDKERVAAALENPNLSGMVDKCLAPTFA